MPENVTTLNMTRFSVIVSYFPTYPVLWLWNSCTDFPANPVFWSCQDFFVTLIRQSRYRPRSGEAIKSAFFRWIPCQRGLTGTSLFPNNKYRNPLRICSPIRLVEIQASTWMSKVCCGALGIKPVPHNPCSPRVWFSAKVGEPFNACGSFSMAIRDAFTF